MRTLQFVLTSFPSSQPIGWIPTATGTLYLCTRRAPCGTSPSNISEWALSKSPKHCSQDTQLHRWAFPQFETRALWMISIKFIHRETFLPWKMQKRTVPLHVKNTLGLHGRFWCLPRCNYCCGQKIFQLLDFSKLDCTSADTFALRLSLHVWTTGHIPWVFITDRNGRLYFGKSE